jgi:hypothetical protein
MLPFIQCHQTRGAAEFGGCANPLASESVLSASTAAALSAKPDNSKTDVIRIRKQGMLFTHR